MKSKKLFKVKQKLIKVLVTVICVITVFFSMPMKSNADILQSIASFLLIIPDGIQWMLNTFVSDETENVDMAMKISLQGDKKEESGYLYNFEVTPYDIFMAGTLTDYGRYKEAIDNISENGDNVKESLEDGSALDAVNAAKDSMKEQNNITNAGNFTTKSTIKMPIIDANFFRKSTEDSKNSADILRPIVSNVYKNLRNFVLVIMLIILLYIGIRIVVSTAVSDQVKYKQYLINWVVGICLIFLMQYIMSGIMNINQVVIDMMTNQNVSEGYVIAFGPVDTALASFYNTGANILDSLADSSLGVVLMSTGNDWLYDKGKSINKFHRKWNIVSRFYAFCSRGWRYNAEDANDGGDGWEEKANSGKEGTVNFMNRKIILSNGATVDDKATWEFNEKKHTIKDVTYALTGVETPVDAAIYNKKYLDESDGRMRALYHCNIAEYCRTLTTFSSSFTHVYMGNKSSTMTDKDGNGKVLSSDNDYNSAAFWGYALLYTLITIETVVFLYKYLKRVIWLAFLTMISPLIAVMYAVDKLGDGKAQTFNMWFKEYLFNSLIQPLHLLLYNLFLGAGMALMQANVIYGVVAYAFMIPAEKFFKKMFGFDKASTPGGLGSPAAGMMAMRGLDRLGGFGPHGKGGKGGKGGSDSTSLAKKIPLAKNKLSVPTSNSKDPLGSGKNSTLNPIKRGNKTGILGGNGKNGNIPYNRGSINRANRSSSGLGRALSSRIAGRITGGKTYNLGHALKGDKKAILKTGGKFLGRQVGRVGGLAAGTLAGAGVGLVSGALASALTGEDKFADSLQKGILVGGASGFNRGGQVADSINNFAEELGNESRRYKASDNPVIAARIKTEDFEREHQAEFSGLSTNEYQDKMDFLNEYFKYADGDSIKDMDQLDRMQEYSTDSNGNIDTTRLAESIENEKAKSVYGDLRVNKNAEQLLHHNKREANPDSFKLTQKEKEKISNDIWKQSGKDKHALRSDIIKKQKDFNEIAKKHKEGKASDDEYDRASNHLKYAKQKYEKVNKKVEDAYAEEKIEKAAREKTEKQINYFS